MANTCWTDSLEIRKKAALTVNSRLCLRRMVMPQKYGYTRSTVLESETKSRQIGPGT
jgi:hypothetical protein